jgi:hypothetical protein
MTAAFSVFNITEAKRQGKNPVRFSGQKKEGRKKKGEKRNCGAG